MTDRIAASLARLFEEHRIVFWYDAAREMRDAYEALDLPGVTRLEVANNEFGLKLRMLRREPAARFLVYREGPEPEMADNWLLDVQLASGLFRADQAAIWLAELGLPAAFEGLVREHAEFFRARGRVEGLKRLMKPDDTRTALRLRMLPSRPSSAEPRARAAPWRDWRRKCPACWQTGQSRHCSAACSEGPRRSAARRCRALPASPRPFDPSKAGASPATGPAWAGWTATVASSQCCTPTRR